MPNHSAGVPQSASYQSNKDHVIFDHLITSYLTYLECSSTVIFCTNDDAFSRFRSSSLTSYLHFLFPLALRYLYFLRLDHLVRLDIFWPIFSS